MTDGNRLQVAVGIVRDTAGRVLVNQRRAGTMFPGRWEFPGGKIQAGETVSGALARELDEELGVRVIRQRPLITVTHDYEALGVHLNVHEVLAYRGEPVPREGQPLQWVEPAALGDIGLLAADVAIVKSIQLPRVCLITDTRRCGVETTLERLARHHEADSLSAPQAANAAAAAGGGRVLVIVREKHMNTSELAAFVSRLRIICDPAGSPVCVHADCAFDRAGGGEGVHLPARTLYESVPAATGSLTGVSCHSGHEIALAHQRGADYVLLSPVSPTESHPGAPVLGWKRFGELCEAAPMPVYALGGMQPSDFEVSIDYGGQGIAMMGAAWK